MVNYCQNSEGFSHWNRIENHNQVHRFFPLLSLPQKPGCVTVFPDLGKFYENPDSLAPFLEKMIQYICGSGGRIQNSVRVYVCVCMRVCISLSQSDLPDMITMVHTNLQIWIVVSLLLNCCLFKYNFLTLKWIHKKLQK